MKDRQQPHSAERRAVLRSIIGLSAAAVCGCGGGSGGDSAAQARAAAQPLPDLATAPPASSTSPVWTSLVVDGYTDKLSYWPGERATLYVSGSKPGTTSLSLYDVTGSVVHAFPPAPVKPQAPLGPAPWRDGFGYEPTAFLTIPALPSGIYLIENRIPVLVKSPVGAVDMVVVYPTNTEAAYERAGGRSLYTGPDLPSVVSFLRPASSRFADRTEGFLRWFKSQDLASLHRTRFIADIDLEDSSVIQGAKLLVLIGHSEYWTRTARENFDRFVDSGGRALVLSGNSMWWQVRYSDDRTQLICHKSYDADPVADPLQKTANWNDPRLKYSILSSIGAEFPRGGYGRYADREYAGHKGWGGFRIVNARSPLFSGVDIKDGDVLTVPTNEYDGAPLKNVPVTSGVPRLDNDVLGFHKVELVGYDYGVYLDRDTVGTWIIFQKTPASGEVINCASTDWCSTNSIAGKDGARVAKIVRNMIDALLANRSPFSA